MKKIVLCLSVIGFTYAFAAGGRAQEGCKNFLGRPDAKLCQTKPAYDACLGLIKQGSVDICVLSSDQTSWVRRTTPAGAAASLAEKGCKKLSGNSYQCGENVINFCHGYKNFFALTQPGANPIASCQAAPAEKTDDGNLYVYAVGLDDRLWTIKKTKGAWGGSQQLAPAVGGGPDACSPNPGKIVVAYRDQANAAHAGFFDYSTNKHGWVNFLSKIGSDPTALCQAGDRVTLFVRGHNNTQLYGSYAENGVWPLMAVPGGNGLAIEDVAAKAGQKKDVSFWDKLTGAGAEFTSADTMLAVYPFGGGMKGSPDGVAFGGDRRAVFVRGTDDHVWWRVTYDNKTWTPWEQVGAMKMTSDPAAVSRKYGEILLFARGENNMLWVTQHNNGQWTAWVPWGGTMAGSPDATSWGDNRVDVFYRGADGSLHHVWRHDAEALIKEPKHEIVPNMAIKHDPTAVGVKW